MLKIAFIFMMTISFLIEIYAGFIKAHANEHSLFFEQKWERVATPPLVQPFKDHLSFYIQSLHRAQMKEEGHIFHHKKEV